MKLKFWELALAIGLVAALLFSAGAQRDQSALAGKLIRLHVVANSDSQADQDLKLRVRDRVLETVNALTAGAESAAEAEQILRENLQDLADTAAEGHTYPVHVSLGRETLPTRDYGSFSLAAGEYETLRIVLGEGAGHNWWCVLFPPLCTEAALEDTELSEDELQLITGDHPVKFKVIEILDWIRSLFA